VGEGGRPRIPNERKRKLGNPGKRPLPMVIAALPPLSTPTIQDAPSSLGEAGRALWVRVAQHARTWVSESDLEALRLLAEAADRRAELMARLANDGWVLYTDKGYAYQHPLAGLLQQTETEMRRWMATLGLTPSDRSKLGVAEVKARSALEELAARRTAHLDKAKGA
jgi:P27 family predicted phage terminase small subunit